MCKAIVCDTVVDYQLLPLLVLLIFGAVHLLLNSKKISSNPSLL